MPASPGLACGHLEDGRRPLRGLLAQLAQLGVKRVSRFVAVALIDQALGFLGTPDLGV